MFSIRHEQYFILVLLQTKTHKYVVIYNLHWEEGRGVHRVLVGKPEGKSPLVRPGRRWEDNIKMDLQEVGGGCGDWMEVA